MNKNLFLLEGQHFFYKRTDGSYILTGAYFIDPEYTVPAIPKKWDFIEKVQVSAEQMEDVYLEQCSIKDGQLFQDLSWDIEIMPESCIKKRHQFSLNKQLDQELESDAPDPIKIAKLQRAKEKIKDWTDLDTYQQALKNLDERLQKGEDDKPVIRQKLKDKIAELSEVS
jgi:hypothetical protein